MNKNNTHFKRQYRGKRLSCDRNSEEGSDKTAKVIFPLITKKCMASLPKGQQSDKRSRMKNQQHDMHLMQLIQKELQLQRREYFRTISSKETLIIKSHRNRNKPGASNTAQDQSKTREELLMTPPLGGSRRSYQQLGAAEPQLTLGKTIVDTESRFGQVYSPWEFTASQELPEGLIVDE